MKKINETQPEVIKGYKVTDSQMQCRGFQFEIGKEFTQAGKIVPCKNGFLFCPEAKDCFEYYGFDNKKNRVFEVEGSGQIAHEGNKVACSQIKFIREVQWDEVFRLVNTGSDNTGLGNSGDSNSGDSNSGYRNSGDSNSGDSNSGDSNSGDSNSGDSNSGDRNSGDRNSGNRNSGNRNSGNRNSGNRNSGNWNSGDRNSGDSNSGYRNSGAFCTDDNPVLWLFNKPTDLKVRDWENHKSVELMYSIDPTIWVDASIMSDEEKKQFPKYETTGGYLKKIPMKEAWANAWHNWSDENRKVFLTLPNFDAEIFKEITGIDTTATN